MHMPFDKTATAVAADACVTTPNRVNAKQSRWREYMNSTGSSAGLDGQQCNAAQSRWRESMNLTGSRAAL